MAINEILSAFVNSNRIELKLIELRANLKIHLSNVELIQFVNQSNLFEFQSINQTIKLNPKLILCKDCLQKNCQNKRNCTQLHLCRYSSHFNTTKPFDKPCTFPHKLTDLPQNVLLLRQYKYDQFDEDILLKLLRLFYEKTYRQISSSKQECQLDVVIPPENEAKDIDFEIIQLLLATREIIVEHIQSKDIKTDFYRRFTLQFQTKDLAETFLETNSILIYNHIPIKFKRTQRKRDSKIIALKFLTENTIDRIRLDLYVETLVGKNHSNIFDMRIDRNQEQIYLIQCQHDINFEHLYKVHSAKNTLQGSQVVIIEIYEIESLEISANFPMNYSRLSQIIGEKRWQQEVFACLSIRDNMTAEIELVNSEITRQWLSQAKSFEENYSLRIQPIIDFISNEIESISSINENSYTIKPTWRIVLTHPTFGDEYRKYIREKLNISIQIIGSKIQLSNNHLRKELARLTNMFIQNFQFHQLTQLDKIQVKIIKENYSRMAHKWQPDIQKTLIAARREVINELLPQLDSSKQQIDTNIQTMIYPIENPNYFPFFSSTNIFPDRLRTYLLDTFHIQLEIQTNSSTQIQLILKGLSKDISDARANLTPLFASVKTIIFRDNQYSIPDIARLTQTIFNRSSIISSCVFSTKTSGYLIVNYFTINSQFLIDEKQIEDLFSKKIFYRFIAIQNSTLNFEKQLQNLLKTIEQNEEICFAYNQSSSIQLAGMKTIVLQIEANCHKLIDEFIPVSCRITLQTNQIKYLIELCSNELIKFEKSYETDCVDLRTKFKNNLNEFLAPKYLHEKIKGFLLELSQLQTISKDFLCAYQIIKDKKTELNNLAIKHHCLMTINASTHNLNSISILNGDLSTAQSDVLVICSTSVYLRQSMIKAAGSIIEQEIHGHDLTKSMFDTSAGQLKQAKRLLFIPWTPPIDQNIDVLRQSIVIFINQAIKFTIDKGFQSIAFPAIGCGGFGLSPDLIASIMIGTIQEILVNNPNIQLMVTFVIPQKNIFDIFQTKNSQKTTIILETAVSNIDTARTLLTQFSTMLK